MVEAHVNSISSCPARANSGGICSGDHVWVGYWPDGIPDGVLCSCGAVLYDKRQVLRDQIAELQRQLAELGPESDERLT